jgi:4a-hydroxytetrahydrobiopterin dehydratase
MRYVDSMDDAAAVEEFVTDHPGWEWSDTEISKTFTFTDFNGSMEFVNRVAEAAEAANHHPDIDIRWNRVTLRLSTHSEGGLTQKDLDLATEIDGLV